MGVFPYTIPIAARATHMYVIGTSGQGKSKFLESLLAADIRAGRGCGLVDPHADLARDTLAHLLSIGFFDDPKTLERVIYLDPTQEDTILPFNILKTPLPPYTLATQVIEAFRRTWPTALAEAPRFTNIALVALLVLIETGQSLIEMPLLLTNTDYRERLLGQVRDRQLVEFFHSRFDHWGRDTAVMTESVLNKVTAFTFNPHLRHLLGASENRLDFRKIMDEGKVLIVNLGHCDGETRRLVGSLVVTGMELAALSRKDADATSRRPFYLFMDEFQDFCSGDGAAKTLAQILSECRKFGLFLHLAHQTLGQISERMSSALGNVGIKVVFSVDRSDAEVMAPKLFAVNTEEIKREANTDTQHPVFSPLSEQWERAVANIQELMPRAFFVKRRGHRVAYIRTQAIPPYTVTASDVDRLIARLVRTHGEPFIQSVQSARLPDKVREPPPLTDWEQVPEGAPLPRVNHAPVRSEGIIFSGSPA
jgi:hypothetical protein